MKGRLILALLAAIVPAVSSAESIGEKAGVNSALGVAPKTSDFVSEAALSDMTEIAAAKIALQKGDSAEQQFAQHMIQDHTKTSDELKGLVTSGAIDANLPTQLDTSDQKKLDMLNSASVAEFRREYAKAQVSAHKNAVSLFERYGKGGDNEKLAAWARNTLPTLQHHLDMAKALKEGTS